MRNVWRRIGLAAAVLVVSGTAYAQDWPNRPIKFVNPSSAGGGADILVRWLATKMQPLAGVPVIIENKPGANANVATDVVVGSKPDGYTVLFNSSSAVIANRFVMKDVHHDAMKDLQPVANVFRMGLVFATPPNSPANNLSDFIAQLKAKQKPILYGVPVVSVVGASALFQQVSKTGGQPVAFKSMGDAVKSVSSGEIDFSFVDATLGIGQAKQGRLKVLGVSPDKRLPAAPDIPTLSEAGLTGYEYVNFWAAYLPAGSPEVAVQKLGSWLRQIARTPEAETFFREQSVEIFPTDAVELKKMMREHEELWVKLAASANIKPE